MDFFDVYILTRLKIDNDANIYGENVDVTADIHEAAEHTERCVADDPKTFSNAADLREKQ
jgi:hypothetical protein